MANDTRKHYIDNLRWVTLMILIPYHAAMAWNAWGEPNYVYFGSSRAISSVVVFFSPFFMPLLFLLAGVGTRYALQKRTVKEYLAERARKLLIPMLFGTLALMPVMTWLADRYNCGYGGGFFSHYAVFFTRFTDLTGADGGFSFGQFWFLLYLFVISAAGAAVLPLLEKAVKPRGVPLWAAAALGLPLPLLHELLSVGGKSLAEFFYLFLLGYFVFAEDETVARIERAAWPLFAAGAAASILDTYLFLWRGGEFEALNTVCKYAAEWLMILALVGLSKRYLDFTGDIPRRMKSRAFLLYIYHFVWVAAFQYLLSAAGGSTPLLFFGTVLLSYSATFICCEISLRSRVLCFLTAVKCIKYPKGEQT